MATWPLSRSWPDQRGGSRLSSALLPDSAHFRGAVIQRHLVIRSSVGISAWQSMPFGHMVSRRNTSKCSRRMSCWADSVRCFSGRRCFRRVFRILEPMTSGNDKVGRDGLGPACLARRSGLLSYGAHLGAGGAAPSSAQAQALGVHALVHPGDHAHARGGRGGARHREHAGAAVLRRSSGTTFELGFSLGIVRAAPDARALHQRLPHGHFLPAGGPGDKVRAHGGRAAQPAQGPAAHLGRGRRCRGAGHRVHWR